MTPSQKKEIEERFDEKFEVQEYTFDDDTRSENRCDNDNADEIKSFLFSTLDQALAEQREEINRIFETEIEGIKKHGALTPCGETTLKILEEIKEDLLKSLSPQQD